MSDGMVGSAYLTPSERFWARVEPDGDCLMWKGELRTGYGRFWVTSKQRTEAHRFAYEERHGAIPDGLTLDHLCRTPGCVNPAHLEAVSMRENILRGTAPSAANARKTHCKRGHPFDAVNTHYYRVPGSAHDERRCRPCDAQRRARRAP